MVTLSLKSSIRLFISALQRTEAISDSFPLLAEKFQSARWQRFQNSHVKEEWITGSFLSVGFVCSPRCYVLYFSLTEQIQQPNLSFRPTGPALPRAGAEKRLFSVEMACFKISWGGWLLWLPERMLRMCLKELVFSRKAEL